MTTPTVPTLGLDLVDASRLSHLGWHGGVAVYLDGGSHESGTGDVS